MTRHNGSINGEQITGPNAPGMWTLNDAQQKSLRGNWGEGLGTIRYLIVGGGGGGGGARPNNINAGGGGGGGVIEGTEILYEGRQMQVQAGSGGGGGPTYDPGSRGSATTFESPAPYAPPDYPGTSWKHVAYGGGGGKSYGGPAENSHGGNGGGAPSQPTGTAAGYGLTPTAGQPGANIPSANVSSLFPDYVPGTRQGYNGGNNNGPTLPADNGGGGGGGAGGAGGDASGKVGGNGGPGYASDITGTTRYYGAGGGGGGPAGGGSGGTGNPGGQGGGPVPVPGPSQPGNAGKGYGGGGGGAAAAPGTPPSGVSGGRGSNGIIILRYPNLFELDLSNVPTAPPSPTSDYNVRIMEEGDVGADHYVAIGGYMNNFKFKRK